jgi:hypothetical protein
MEDDSALVPVDSTMPALATEHPLAKKVVAALSRRTPDKARRTRPGPAMADGTRMKFTYAPWAYIAARLNKVFGPAWSYEIVGVPEHIKLPPTKGRQGKPPAEREEILVFVRLRTPWDIQVAAGSHVYYPSNPEQLLGDVVQAAQSKGLRRAAARWGPGLDLYFDTEQAEDPVDQEVEDARTAWRSAVGKCGLVEKGAVPLLSKKLADDPDALTTVDDLVAATGEEGAKAYWILIAALEEAVKEIEDVG